MLWMHFEEIFSVCGQRRTAYLLRITWILYWIVDKTGTGIRGLMRGMATILQGYQELLVVTDEVGRPPR